MTATKRDSTSDQDLVLANLEWVRRLSRQLVADTATADDLVQRAWLVANARGSQVVSRSAGRAWLAGVVKNLARDQWRRDAQRQRRELIAHADRRVQEAPHELLARSELSHELAGLVLELDEPFRRTMLLRWFEGLQPADIASAEGLPGSTVRTRLHRGMEELRRKLDARHGGRRRDWALAMIPVASLPIRPRRAAGAASLKLAAAVALTLVVGGSAWWAHGAFGSGAMPSGPLTPLGSVPKAIGGSLEDDVALNGRLAAPRLSQLEVEDGGDRTSAPSGALATLDSRSGASDSPDVTESMGLRGIVVLPDGTPVADVDVRIEPTGSLPSVTARKIYVEDDGTFSWADLPDGVYRVSVEGGDFPLRSPALITARALPHRLEIDAIAVMIVAHDEEGEPIPMRGYRCTLVATRGVNEDKAYDSQSVSLVAQYSHTELVRPGFDYMFSAEAPSGEQYSAWLSANQVPGSVRLVLRRQPPEFGSLKVAVDSAGLPGTFVLSQVSAQHEVREFEINSKETRASHEQLEYPALPPGAYHFEFDLGRFEFIGLRQPNQRIEIRQEEEHAIVLEAFLGGALSLLVSTPHQATRSGMASVRVRKRGSDAWEERALLSKDERYHIREASALLNGPRARSDAWEVGHYEVEVTAEGYAPAFSSFRVMEERTAMVEVTMMPI